MKYLFLVILFILGCINTKQDNYLNECIKQDNYLNEYIKNELKKIAQPSTLYKYKNCKIKIVYDPKSTSGKIKEPIMENARKYLETKKREIDINSFTEYTYSTCYLSDYRILIEEAKKIFIEASKALN